MTNITKDERIKWIGASEVASVFGLSPYATPFELWHQKAGRLAPPDLDDAERVQAGQFLEPAIAAWAAEKFDLHIRKVNRYIESPVVAQFGSSLDYETVKGRNPVEIKNVDFLVFRDEWEAEGDTITRAPAHIALQQQSQIACTRKPLSHLIVCVSGNTLYRMETPAHAPTIARINAGVTDFWRSIREGNPPDPNFGADYETLRILHNKSGGGELDLSHDNRIAELIAEYDEARTIKLSAEKRVKAAHAEILSKISDADFIKANGGHIKSTDVAGSVTPAGWQPEKVRSGYRKLTIKQTQEKAA
jgi:putative phage-type endonuclease